MKKAKTIAPPKVNDMREEYDFTDMKGGVRGKYYEAYRAGHKVIIHKEDGTDSVQYFKLEDGAVMLEPDVRKYFPTSDAVNKALRSLIEIIPAKKRVSSHPK
ncbi:MAG: hypothetical protein HY892_04695 [Deltaproteobacteria bacterium]|nr:hypothetical protein [Deltaproteobacteria bacterium]